MENKYYDLIISLIKKHRKYSDYESIVDEIAEDVYEHSKSILETVNDQEVITAYINKVITTSFITVPKRLNMSTHTRRTISPETIIAQAVTVQEGIVNTSVESTDETLEEEDIVDTSVESFNETLAEEDLVDTSVESTDETLAEEDLVDTSVESFDETLEEEDLVDTSVESFDETLAEEDLVDTSVESLDETLEEEDLVDTSVESFDETLEEEDLVDTSVESFDETLEEEGENDTTSEGFDLSLETVNTDAPIEESETISVNKTFVDNMINGLPATTIEQTNDGDINSLPEEFEPEENISEVYNNLESVDALEDTSLIDNTDTLTINDELEELSDITESELNTGETTLTEAEPAENADEIAEDFTNTTTLEEESALDIVDDTFSLDLDDNMPAFSINELADSIEENSLVEIDNAESALLEESTTIETTEELSEINNDDTDSFPTPSYKCFDYTPSEPDYNYSAEEFRNCIDILDKKQPNKQIATICKLKYKNNRTVDEISTELNISKEDVLDVLSQIINAIKD